MNRDTSLKVKGDPCCLFLLVVRYAQATMTAEVQVEEYVPHMQVARVSLSSLDQTV
jgi:hypothetical protein